MPHLVRAGMFSSATQIPAVFCLLVLASCPASPQASDEATQTCHTITLSGSLTLQQAVEQILAQDRDINCTSVELPSGAHTITSQTLFTAELTGLRFVGVGENVCVSCNYSVATNYTWYFDHLESVVLQNIHFEGCPRPLRLDTIADVEISNCSFRYFSEAALDIYNSHHTVFTGSTLEHNRGTGIGEISYRGNTGGVSFGYNTLPVHFNSPTLHVSNSTFRNNNATAESVFLTSSEAFARRIFTGRGGSMAVFSNESQSSLNVTITDCVFERNSARSFGGAMYLLSGGVSAHHKMLVQGSRFVSNKAGIGAGGVHVTFANSGPEDDPLLVSVVDCNFYDNTASHNGGGMYVSSHTDGSGNHFHISGSTFSGNWAFYGGALVLKSFAVFLLKTTLSHHEITNCTFRNNSGNSGVFSLWFVFAAFTGTNWLMHNQGNSLQIITSLVHISGELHFVNNSGRDDSALHMLSFAQVVLSKELFLNFEGNTGRFGASMFVESQYATPEVYDQSAPCFVQYETESTPDNWNEVTVQFHNNEAILASALYMLRLDMQACSSVFSYNISTTNTQSNIIDWPIWNFGDTNVNTGYQNKTERSLSVQTTAKRLVTSNSTIRAWPGLKFRVEIMGVDEFDNPTATLARFYFLPFGESVNMIVKFRPEVVVMGTDPITGLLMQQFTVFYGTANTSGSHDAHQGGLGGEVSIQVPYKTTLEVQPTNFTLEVLPCPGGYHLHQHNSLSDINICVCNKDISEVLICEDDQDTIVIKRGKWAVYIPRDTGANMEFYPCPTGYCRCNHNTSFGKGACVYSYTNSNPDLQCTCGRRGVLCGECVDGSKGVSALLNKCVSCSDASGLLILALIIADAVVFVVLILLDKPLPSWTYPFIFYVQLAPISGLYFPDSFNYVGKYLYFVGSASSFYFPYDFCLYGNMSSQMAYFIRFLPLFIATLICTTILLFRFFFKKVSPKTKPTMYHGVWWITLLLYSHVVYTSMTVLNCPSITDTDGTTSARWFVNGEVKCFTGGHIPLALLAILVLLAAALLIPLTAVLPVRQWKDFHEALAVSYRDNCQWWSAVELGRRLFFILFTVALPQNDAVPVLLLAVCTAVYGYVQPYKKQVSNIIETVVNLNFLLLLLLNATSYFHDDLFTFPSLSQSSSEDGCPGSISGIAVVSWILTPFYYLPLLTLCITTAVFLIPYLRPKCSRPARSSSPVNELKEPFIERSSTLPYHKWSISLNNDGYIQLDTDAT